MTLSLQTKQHLAAKRVRAALPDDAPANLLWELMLENASIKQAKAAYKQWQLGQTAPPLRSQRPLRDSDATGDTDMSYAQLVDAMVASEGIIRREACRLVAKQHPQAYREFVASCLPAGRTR